MSLLIGLWLQEIFKSETNLPQTDFSVENTKHSVSGINWIDLIFSTISGHNFPISYE